MALLYWKTYIRLAESDPWDILPDHELHEALGIESDALEWTVIPGKFAATPVVYSRDEGRLFAIAAAAKLSREHPQYSDRICIHLVDHYELNPFPVEVALLKE